MIGDPYSILVIVGLILFGLLLYVLLSIVKNNKGERFFFDRTQMYAIQLRIEKLFGQIHTRKD